MFKIVQLIIGIFLIVLIIPQTPTENIVLRKFSETGFFTNYNEAKNFLNIITWVLIFSFLFLTFLLNFFNQLFLFLKIFSYVWSLNNQLKENLGWKDSNLRIAGPKLAALPLGHTPIFCSYIILQKKEKKFKRSMDLKITLK